MKYLLCTILIILASPLQDVISQEDYTFDISEIEKKPYGLNGYAEFLSSLYWLDKDSALYKLKFYDQDHKDILDELNGSLQLGAKYDYKFASAIAELNANFDDISHDFSSDVSLYSGYVLLKLPFSTTVDIGKKPLKWGKGYAWNPIAFIDRPKNPDDPTLSLEGFIVTSADYIKSFNGSLKNLALTLVLLPVYEGINDRFGEINHVNLAGKLYLLIYDTDIDLAYFLGESKPNQIGLDFSRNITSNSEIHGEIAHSADNNKRIIDEFGSISESKYDSLSYLLGLRYLTESNITTIFEYYHNGTGFTSSEFDDYYSFIADAYETYITSSEKALLEKAISLTDGGYGRPTPSINYLYLRSSIKEPFNILYFSPALTWIFNVDDRSFSLSPEFVYTRITNLELRLKAVFIAGDKGTEFGEKHNNFRMEFRARLYF